MWKIGGAKAALGGSLDEVISVAQKAIDKDEKHWNRIKSVNFRLWVNLILLLLRVRWNLVSAIMVKRGIEITDLKSADEMAEMMVNLILPDLPFKRNDEVVVLVSGLGATPVMELYILYNKITEILNNNK